MALSTALLPPIAKQHVWASDGLRHYEIGGGTRPGVTSVLDKTSDKTFLLRWEERIGKEQAVIERTRAARRGTALHKRIENKLLFGEQEQLSLFDQEFEEKYGLCGEVDYLWLGAEPYLETVGEPVLIEGPVYWEPNRDEEHIFGNGFGGTIDCVTRNPETGGLILRDWKSSRKVKKTEFLSNYCLQQAAYKIALMYSYPELEGQLERCEIVIFNLQGHAPQVHSIEGGELRLMEMAWFKRLEQFYAIQGAA